MQDTYDRFQFGSGDYDSQLADRIKAMLRDDDSNSLPPTLATDAEIQLISNEIRQGGLGRVGRYYDETLEREVAVKFINRGLDSDHEKRFQREVMITSSLDHPGVVPIYSIGKCEGQAYYTMRFVSGVTFAEAVEQFHQSSNNALNRWNPEFRSLLESFKSACSTIGYAHGERRVWHRDIKPQNIMIENGLTVVLDWGLAKRKSDIDNRLYEDQFADDQEDDACLTRADQYLGSPAYMAPEQAMGDVDQIDHLTDIYGLGATLFELLTGRPPHRRVDATAETKTALPTTACDVDTTGSRASEIQKLLREIVAGPSPSARKINPAVPSELDSICRRAMALNKTDRYQRPQQIVDDIENWLVQSDVTSHRYSRIETAGRWIRKHSGIAAVLCLASLLIAAISIGSFFSVSNSKKRTERALTRMRAERAARIDDQLKAFVVVPPIQAEVFLKELESYSVEELKLPIESLAVPQQDPAAEKRLQLIHLSDHPNDIIPLLASTNQLDVDELSLICSAIRSPQAFNRGNVMNRLWQLSRQTDSVVASGAMLSQLAPVDPNWQTLAPRLVDQLMSVNPRDVTKFSSLLKPVREKLKPPLMLRYQSDSVSLARKKYCWSIFV